MELQAFFVIGQTPAGEIHGTMNVPNQHIDAVLSTIEKLKFALLHQEAKARSEKRIVAPPITGLPPLRAS